MLRRTFFFGALSTGALRASKSVAGELIVHKSSITGPGLQSKSLIYVPPGHNPEKKDASLLLWLHGASLRGNDVQRLRRYGPPRIGENGATSRSSCFRRSVLQASCGQPIPPR